MHIHNYAMLHMSMIASMYTNTQISYTHIFIQGTSGSTIVRALSHVLEHFASMGCRPQRITNFHAIRPPRLSVFDYLSRIFAYFSCGDECLVVGLVYIDRIMKLNPTFVVSAPNIHRLTLTSVVVATKFMNDAFYSNKTHARVGGVHVQELNTLETKFLQLLNWRLHVMPEEYDQYCNHLLVALHA